VQGKHLSVDGSFVEANAAKESRIPRQQLAEAAQVNHTVRQYLVELEQQNPTEPVHQQDQVSTTDPDATYATKVHEGAPFCRSRCRPSQPTPKGAPFYNAVSPAKEFLPRGTRSSQPLIADTATGSFAYSASVVSGWDAGSAVEQDSHLAFSLYFCVIGGTMPFKRRYSTSCP